LGDAADLISAPVLTGFKIGIDVSIAVGQLDSLLGVSNEVAPQLWSRSPQSRTRMRDPIMSILYIAALLIKKP
jgi:MFS superfamily sulfate permease-like transporter